MSILVLLLPARARLGPSAQAAEGAVALPTEYRYVLTPDGLAVGSQGRGAPSLLPRADSVVAVLHDFDVSWHLVQLPRAPAARMRAALAGLLEEQLLDEADAVHFAVAPGAPAGKPAWIAATHRAWLADQLAALEKAGVFVERVVPASAPGEPFGHFHADADTADSRSANTWLTRGDEQGLQCLRLSGGLTRAMQATWSATPARWTATPAVAAQAERWLGAPVSVQSDAERALVAVRSGWNVRQFDLMPHHRGARALRDVLKRLQAPAWRPARLGLAALVLLQLGGLNLWAWAQRHTLQARQDEMVALVRETHPQVRAVLDAPQQMRRETDALRAAAGLSGDGDLETLLAAAAGAWPDGRGPAESLRFEGGRLTVSATGWDPQQIDAFRSRLRPAGYALEAAGGLLTLRRAESGAPS